MRGGGHHLMSTPDCFIRLFFPFFKVVAELCQTLSELFRIAESTVSYSDGARHIEVISWHEQYLSLVVHGVLGQSLRIHIVVVFDEAGGTLRVAFEAQMRLSLCLLYTSRCV